MCFPNDSSAFRALDSRGSSNVNYLFVAATIGLLASGGIASFSTSFDRNVLTGSRGQAMHDERNAANHTASRAQAPQLGSSSNAASGGGSNPSNSNFSDLLSGNAPVIFAWLATNPTASATSLHFAQQANGAAIAHTSTDPGSSASETNGGANASRSAWSGAFAIFAEHFRPDYTLAFADLSSDQIALRRGEHHRQMSTALRQMTRLLNEYEFTADLDENLKQVLAAAIRDVIESLADGRLDDTERETLDDLANALSLLGDNTLMSLRSEFEQLESSDGLLADEQATRAAIADRLSALDSQSDWNALPDDLKASVEALRVLDENAHAADPKLESLSAAELLDARADVHSQLAEIARSDGELDQAARDQVGELLALDQAMQRELLARDYDIVDPRFRVSEKFAERLHDPIEARLVAQGVKYLDELYALGGKVPGGTNGEGEPGIDCSGFTRLVYENAEGVGVDIGAGTVNQDDLPRVSDAEKRPGDLLFGDGGRGATGHVGIYLGYFDVRPYVDLEARPDLARFDGSVEIYMHSSTRIDASGKEGVQFTALDDWSTYNQYVTRPPGMDGGTTFDASAYQVSSADVLEFAKST